MSDAELLVCGPAPNRLEFIAVGHLCWDLVDGERRAGGASLYAALTAARLGLKAGIITSAGKDLEGLVERGRLEGISLLARIGDETTTFENRYDSGEDARPTHKLERHQRLAALAGPIDPSLLDRAREHFSMAPDGITLYCPIAQEITSPLAGFSEKGLCGVTPQGFLRQWNETGEIRPKTWEASVEALQYVDLVSLSEEDVTGISAGDWTMDYPVDYLAVTDGPDGSRIRLEHRWVQIPSLDNIEASDPTGAGDAFAAAWLVALRAGKGAVQAARYATSAATLVIEGPLMGKLDSTEDLDRRFIVYCERVLGESRPGADGSAGAHREDFTEYCDEIELFFFRYKGRTGKLSPSDFARVKRWYDDGLSIAEVLNGIAEAFRSQSSSRDRDEEDVNSLSYCESFVRDSGH